MSARTRYIDSAEYEAVCQKAVDALVAEAPPLSSRQVTALRALLGPIEPRTRKAGAA